MSIAVITYVVDFSTQDLTLCEITAARSAVDGVKAEYAVLDAGEWSDTISCHVVTLTSTYDPDCYSEEDLTQAYWDMRSAAYEAGLHGVTSTYDTTLVIDDVEIIGGQGSD